MKKITACIFLSCALVVSAFAQRVARDPDFSEWETTPYSHPVPQEFANLSAYMILNSVNVDYKYEGKGVTTYYSIHRIIKVLDTKGIEQFKSISIPVFPDTKIQIIKARTIMRNGKVHEIPKDMIKTTINGYGTYEVVIALEGLERNAEVEFLLKEIRDESLYGSEKFQFSIPVQSTWFTVTYPKELKFEAKSVNGFPAVKDTLLKSTMRRQMKVYKGDIPALEYEPYSFYDLHRMGIEYKFSYETDDNEQRRVFSWDDYAKTLHDTYYKMTDKEKTAVNKYISKLGVTNRGTDLENVKAIENGIKNNIVLYSDVEGAHSDNLDSIIEHKAASASGYIKLFAACFTLADVKHEIGITTDKHEHRFDSKFEDWGTINHIVFYFPNLKQYISPTSVYYRYPMVHSDVVNNKGLFCAIPPEGKLTGVMSEVRTITPLPAKENAYNIKADITFTKDMESQADVTYSYSGYRAMDLRTILVVLTGERKIDVIKREIALADIQEDIIKYKASDEAFTNYNTNKPIEISATVNTSYLVEKAGPRYLFKLGTVIGTKTEMFKKMERKLPVDIDYPFSQNDTITLTIPKGYKILNPDVMRKRADYVDANGKPVVSFIANYTIKGDKLTVTVNEFCKQLHYSLTEFEYFRTVINTAAEFNNVALILAKK